MKQPEGHLTLHLYRKDEVLAGLRWAIITRNSREAIFWGIELFDSDMEQAGLEMLEFVWLTHIGFGSMELVRRICEIYTTGELDRDTWISLLFDATRIRAQDSSILHLLIRGASVPDTWKPTYKHRATYSSPTEAFVDAFQRGKTVEAWLLARAIPVEEQWQHLETAANKRARTIMLAMIRSLTLSDVEQRAAAFILVSMDPHHWQKANVELAAMDLPRELQELVDEWDSEESLRKRRVYAIRSESMLYLCGRSEQPVGESNESEIQYELLGTLKESPYWSNVLSEYMDDTNTWKSDLHHEMFYETYFPQVIDDIPDEWSLADREKSHGRGLGRSDKAAAVQRFLNVSVQRTESIGLWVPSKAAVELVSMDWTSIYNEKESKCAEYLKSVVPLRPVQKVFEVC